MSLKIDSGSRLVLPRPDSLSGLDVTFPEFTPSRDQDSKFYRETLLKTEENIQRFQSLTESVQIRINGAESNISSSKGEISNSGVMESLMGNNKFRRKNVEITERYLSQQKEVLGKSNKFSEILKETSQIISGMLEESKKLKMNGKIEEALEIEKKATEQLKVIEESILSIEKAILDSGNSYAKALRGQNVSNQALLDKFDTTIAIMEVANQAGMLALVAAGTLATGGVAGIAIGAARGAAYAVVNNSGQAVLHAGYGNKTSQNALSDALSQTGEDIKTSVITAVSMGTGMAAGNLVRGIGAVQKLGSVGTAVVGGASGGATGGVSGSVLGSGTTYIEAARDFHKNYSHLEGEDRITAWNQIKDRYRLNAKSVAIDTASGAGFGAIGGALGGRMGMLREGARTLSGKVGAISGELIGDISLGLGSSLVNSHVQGRELTQKEIFSEVGSALRSSLIGGARQKKYGTSSSSFSQDDVRKVVESRLKSWTGNDSGLASDLGRIDRLRRFFNSKNTHDETPVEFIFKLGSDLPRPLDSARQEVFDRAKETYFNAVSRYATDQHVTNPEQFTSHGFDHTIRVTKNMRMITSNNPETLTRLRDKYNLTNEQAQFALDTVGVFHDFGYAYYGGLSKSAHTLASSRIFNTPEIKNSIRLLLDPDGTNPKVKVLLDDMSEAILQHGSDKVEPKPKKPPRWIMDGPRVFENDLNQAVEIRTINGREISIPVENDPYTIRLVTDAGTILVRNSADISNVIKELEENTTPIKEGKPIEVRKIQVKDEQELKKVSGVLADFGLKIPVRVNNKVEYMGRHLDFISKGDKVLGLPIQQDDILVNPLAMIRIADNIDESFTRLSPLQRSKPFQEIYERMGYGSLGASLRGIEDVVNGIGRYYNEEPFSAIRAIRKKMEHYDSDFDFSYDDIMKHAGRSCYEEITPIDMLNFYKEKRFVEPVLSKGEFVNIDNYTLMAIREFSLLRQGKQAPHYSGCLAINEIQLQDNVMTIRVNNIEYVRMLSLVPAHEDFGQSVGLYKAGRVKEAYSTDISGNGDILSTVTINGKPILVEVVD
ncbi:MAG TPA: hypothetical protein PKA63_02485 [Oligoflexia bacterium]|nr:hypothetical protein [Oligoflexia bacterium]HMP47519.1 hypothetical protein [Oligoflexia bacterium]